MTVTIGFFVLQAIAISTHTNHRIANFFRISEFNSGTNYYYDLNIYVQVFSAVLSVGLKK